MSKLYLIRHGETEWNLHNRTQGCVDVPLNENGKLQAIKLARRMSSCRVDRIYSSNLSRAVQTANYISQVVKKDVVVMEEFREINFGLWEGLTFEEIKRRFPEEHRMWRESPHRARIPGGEMLHSVLHRVMSGLKKILKDCEDDQNIVIVSHGGPIKLMVLGLLEIDISKYNKFRQHNTAVNVLEVNKDGKAVLTLYNDTCHLF